MIGRPCSLLFGGALALFMGSASGQDSCVQVTSATYVPSSSKDVASDYMFQMEGRTEVTANTVRVPHVVLYCNTQRCLQDYFKSVLSRRRVIPMTPNPSSTVLVSFVSSLHYNTVAPKVNLAVIIDASGSVDSTEILLEREFAKNAAASFASRNLFGMCTLWSSRSCVTNFTNLCRSTSVPLP